jgi:TRAP-type C4-dicarboxylate transport system permease small subunit
MQADGQAAAPGVGKAGWGEPLVRFDAAWQRLESRLCTGVLVAEILSLTLWIFLRGLATDFMPGGSPAGLLCRSMITTALFGTIAHLATKQQTVTVQRIVVTAAMLLGVISGAFWAHVGVAWASNLLNWLQNASVLMLIGGLRGLATRLTFWVAFLGASLASSRGKHIHVDVLLRYVPVKLRLPTTILGLAGATVVSSLAVVGFCDYIAIAAFQVNANQPCPGDTTKECDTPAGEKFGSVMTEVSADFFVLGRQMSLDLRSFPHVLFGTPYDKFMTAGDWNTWLDGSDWGAHFDKAAVDSQHMDATVPGAYHIPAVEVPGSGGAARGLLVRELDLIFPFGFAMIALKFLLRIVLLISGSVTHDMGAELDEEALARANQRDEEAARGTT